MCSQYHRTVNVRRLCGLLSNSFDHLFFTVTTRLRCDCYMLYRKLSFRVFLLSLSTCNWDHCYSLKLEEMGSTVQCWVLSSVGIAVLYKYQTLNMDKLTNNFADDEHYKSGACKKRGELSCRRCC